MNYYKFILRHRIDTTRIRAEISRNRIGTSHNGADIIHNIADTTPSYEGIYQRIKNIVLKLL